LTKEETYLLPVDESSFTDRLSTDRSFPFHADMQKILFGKQLLLEELPFPLEEIYGSTNNMVICFFGRESRENRCPV